MKITCNTAALEESLKAFHKEAVAGMERMVRKLSYTISFTAIDNTPIGDSALHRSWYDRRTNDPSFQSFGLNPIEGFARGSWRASTDGTYEMQSIYGKESGQQAEYKIRMDLADYKLGETVMISNFGPYIKSLENNYSSQTRGQGIVSPTVDSVMRTYQYSLDDYYKQSY
jgi:hypothetical protein